MKLLRYLPLVAMFFALSGIAKADPIDFKLGVLDPSGFNTTPIFSTSFVFNFDTCATGQVPPGAGTYEGCFSAINDTGQTVTSLLLEFPNTTAFTGQTANCTVSPSSLSLFTSASCALVGSEYVLNFTGGDIQPNEYLLIAENGVSASDFPTVDGTLNPVPEPSSIWLLSTGTLLLGAFFYYKRRNGLGDQSL
jgi:hypothetical protein